MFLRGLLKQEVLPVSKDRDVREVEQRLEQYGDLLREQRVPERTRQHWRGAVREGNRSPDRAGSLETRPGSRRAAGRTRRPPRILVHYLAAVLILALAVVYAFPTISLYAGSLPMVGPFFRMIGADRGLQLAADQGVAHDLYLAETIDDVELELVNVVADRSRTVLGFRISAPEGKLDQGMFISVRITDQWGREIGRQGAYYRVSHEDGMDVYTGSITNEGLARMTRHINVMVDAIGDVQGPWAFRVPVNYSRAVALERTYEVGALSEERSGVQLEVAKVELHATETVITYIFHGLYGFRGVDGVRMADDSRRMPELYTADGERVMAVRAQSSDLARDDGPLALRVSYEPLPEGTRGLRVVHGAVARHYGTVPGAGRTLDEPAPSFVYRISDGQVELAGPAAQQLWGTTVEHVEAALEDRALRLTVMGTGGSLVQLVGFRLVDDSERSYSLAPDGFEMESETKLGHISGDGMHFRYTLTYALEDDVREVTLEFTELLKKVVDQWEIHFSLPE